MIPHNDSPFSPARDRARLAAFVKYVRRHERSVGAPRSQLATADRYTIDRAVIRYNEAPGRVFYYLALTVDEARGYVGEGELLDDASGEWRFYQI